MIRYPELIESTDASIPRESGDDPNFGAYHDADSMYSPRERG